MQKKTVRSGLVGAGFSATFHFEAIEKVYGANVEVIGVHAKDMDMARAFAQKREIQAFESLDELIANVDVVHVNTPPYAHEPVSVAALAADKHVICEKPLTGYFGDGSDDFHWDNADMEVALEQALTSVERMLEAERNSKGRLMYAENWVYSPAIQKEREILEKTGAQILWIHGEEAHSGSHSVDYAYAARCGGGVLIGKGCHPLSAALYLKRVEGRVRDGKPIRPKAVSARAHAITKVPDFRDEGHIRCDYYDIDDFSMIHIVFEDDTIATVFASDIVLGGIHNWLEICANNHRSLCNINPNTAMQTYNPVDANFRDIYTVEKIETKQGWACTSPDEDFFTGYPQEMEAFYRCAAYGDSIESDMNLAADSISTIYSAYVSAARKGAEVPVKAYG
ncbi:MAG: Gfo/Idh/MocA family oxidoreductase [Planctomycetes bacterium]|nr:Gfo/Idh/MocA family oxidoreductase [Planctomycetota bacterium]MBL7038382.1 Gfo/Idh/MocA family oxidoreductase [Pirellulaceae bacterium]